ncbi:RedY protein [Streptomyces sp. TRM 70351]|uniref:RedY protein n=1 Tax=Streptomyces sp. TRM 70351 TaxID=3116552 RepID=UPI002E7C12B8|nr:RedY protein [Streptomyces sp. TRM 70351]MEE1928873.1 RedY protein [Streptomyces sp. TRM 70351]
MEIIVHRIRLRGGSDSDEFEEWVRETDYEACQHLPGVISFSVQRMAESADEGSGVHYFEVIAVTSRSDFSRDMETETFRRLADDFDVMAEVVEEWAGERIEPGYTADRVVCGKQTIQRKQ